MPRVRESTEDRLSLAQTIIWDMAEIRRPGKPPLHNHGAPLSPASSWSNGFNPHRLDYRARVPILRPLPLQHGKYLTKGVQKCRCKKVQCPGFPGH